MIALTMYGSAMIFKDFYKVGHYEQYPAGTTKIFTNLTARNSKKEGINEVVFFGLQYFLMDYLLLQFARFFKTSENDLRLYSGVINECLGIEKEWSHIKALAELGYLPIEIYALPEGSIVPIGVPMLVITNTHPDFYWLPNMLETIMSAILWQPSTSATIARRYRTILEHYAKATGGNPAFVDYQGHDFSFRGMSSLESAVLSGMGHLLYFKGTDTIPAVLTTDLVYGAGFKECAFSVPATEHSVMSAYGPEKEYEAYLRLVTEIYPTGIVSIVSDTYNLWTVLTDYINRPELNEAIKKRDGKVVFRPDSGDPQLILCGDPHSDDPAAKKGVVQILWETFGGVVNEKGFKELDSHVGVIYGDAISLNRCDFILDTLQENGFASTNIVFGIGSYSYQYNTRDTFGFAMKATAAVINDELVPLYKEPITDIDPVLGYSIKKSHKGLVKVLKENGEFVVKQGVSEEEFYEDNNELKLVYRNGELLKQFNFSEVKQNTKGN